MLGRLRMSLAQCQAAYLKLSERIFNPKRHQINVLGRSADFLQANGKFNSKELEKAIKEVVIEYAKSEKPLEELLQDSDPRCKVFVASTRVENSKLAVLRSYDNDLPLTLFDECTIWEACRATSAAPTFFDPIKIGPFQQQFVDGGLVYNNPIQLLHREAEAAWPSRMNDAVFVSIGTGSAPGSSLDGGLRTIIDAMNEIVTQTEQTSEDFANEHSDLVQRKAFFRFQVFHGLADVGLEEYRLISQIASATETYQGLNDTITKVRDCVQSIVRPDSGQRNLEALSVNKGQFVLKCQRALYSLMQSEPSVDRQKQIFHHGERVPGTCEWIQRNSVFIDWLNRESQLLWLSAGPGKGKSMMSLYLLEVIERRARMSHNNEILIFYFFTERNDHKRNTGCAMLRSLIYQILEHAPVFIQSILPKLQLRGDELFSDDSFDDMWAVFEHMLRYTPPPVDVIHCVLDGLDECEHASLILVLSKLKKLFKKADEAGKESVWDRQQQDIGCNFKCIVASREQPAELQSFLQSSQRINLEMDTKMELEADLDIFISEKLRTLFETSNWDAQTSRQVKRALRGRAEGQFLWASLLAKSLEGKRGSQVSAILDEFPRKLNSTYSHMIRKVDRPNWKLVWNVLCWVALANRALTLRELGEAIEFTAPEGSSQESFAADIVSFCEPFLQKQDQLVVFIHSSAREYLQELPTTDDPMINGLREELARGHAKIASKCFNYMLKPLSSARAQKLAFWKESGLSNPWESDSNKDAKSPLLWDDKPLLHYSILYFFEHERQRHYHDAAAPSVIQSMFYSGQAPLSNTWLRLYWQEKEKSLPPASFSTLHLAAYFGLTTLIGSLLHQRQFLFGRSTLLDAQDETGATPLLFAAQNGHAQAVTALIERGAQVNKRIGKVHGSVLIAAILRGRSEIVRLLLEHGADVNAIVEGPYGSALTAASWRGDQEMIELLLDHEARVNAQSGGTYGNALTAAAARGHRRAVECLLDNHAQVNQVTTGRYGCALIAACFDGNEGVVDALLSHDAEVNLHAGTYGSALAAASFWGNVVVVRKLLDVGAKVDSKVGGRYGSALAAAAFAGNEEVARLLLEHDANVNLEVGGKYGSALSAATFDGNESLVLLLLKEGANIEFKGNDGYEARLVAAISRGDGDMVKLLLTKGANVNMQMSGQFGHALVTAIMTDSGNSISMLNLLLRHGANVNAQINGPFGSPLMAAVLLGSDEMVEKLLEAGAEVDAVVERSHSTPLIAAASQGDEAVVRTLLAHGAKVNATVAGGYGNAVTAAAFNGHTKVTSTLLDHGADMNKPCGGIYGGPLIAAAAQGNEAMVHFLLEAGARTNMNTTGRYGNELVAAAFNGNSELVDLLLRYGSAPGLQVGGNYGNALTAACFWGNELVVRRLLASGDVDVNVTGCSRYGSPLAAAAFAGQEEVVRLLLQNGANVNLKAGRYGDALAAATYDGNGAVIELLVSELLRTRMETS